MTDHDAIWDYRDGQQALRLAEVLGVDGRLVEWTRLVDGDWEAVLSGPSLPGRVAGRGRSRVSAISQAHVRAIRRLRLDGVPANQTQSLYEKRWSEGKGTGSESARCLSPFPAVDVRCVEDGDRHLEDSEPVPVLDSARPSHTPSHGPDFGAGIVSVAPTQAEPVPSS